MLDWELAHLGDPAEDLGWITVNSWRFGVIDKPVGGFGSVEEMLEGYRSAGGEAIEAERVLYWRTLGSLRWGLICRRMAAPGPIGVPLPVERAMIVRRISETESIFWTSWRRKACDETSSGRRAARVGRALPAR